MPAPDDILLSLVAEAERDPSGHGARVDRMLRDYPDDARLHFLRASALVAEGRHIEAHDAFSTVMALAPDFAIARFQFGLFQLTSGEADNALGTWGRLDRLPDGHYLRKFVDGLRCLIRDDFKGAIAQLEDGIRTNEENPPLNRDMQLLIDRSRPHLNQTQPSAVDEPASETSFMLSQLFRKKNLN